MQTKFFCFTRHSAHGTLDHQEIEEELRPVCTFYSFQTEVCPETGREHVQGYVVLKARSRAVTFARKFPSHVESRNGTHAQAFDYTQKEETRKPGTFPVKFGSVPSQPQARVDLDSFRDDIIAGATNMELLARHAGSMARYPRFLQMVRNEKLRQDVFSTLPDFIPRLGWQFVLAQRLEARPCPRSVHWRWEPIGNVGKSYFALHYKPVETFVITGGKHADIHYAYAYEPTVIFDWSRCNEGSFPYGLVEQFKNGYFFSTKYESTAKRFQVPHVVVFANFAPDITQMSLDRWDINQIQ